MIDGKRCAEGTLSGCMRVGEGRVWRAIVTTIMTTIVMSLRAVRPRRVEVLTGPERRRKWPDEVKIAIVAEALVKGVVVSEVARRHDIAPSQLFGWMRRFRAEARDRHPVDPPMFAPVVARSRPGPCTRSRPCRPSARSQSRLAWASRRCAFVAPSTPVAWPPF